MSVPEGELEWLETNLLGSFSLACVDRKLRRKYHALLTVRDPGHGDSWNLLAETRETLSSGRESLLLADSLSSASEAERCAFSPTPHALHHYRALGVDITRSVRLGARDQVEIRYSVSNLPAELAEPLRLQLEPLLRCRPLHQLTQENPFLDGTCVKLGDEVRMLPYAGMPAIAMRIYGAQASFEEQGTWLPVHYAWEAARGYAASESLFSPGRFTVALSQPGEFTFVLGLHRVEAPAEYGATPHSSAAQRDSALSVSGEDSLARAASQFFCESARHEHALVAGYPWLGVRSRDTLLALPGVYLASGSWESTAQVLSFLAKSRVRGLIPSVPAFARGQAGVPSVEASLLFARTVQWFKAELGEEHVSPFMPVVCELLESIAEGCDPHGRFERGVSIYSEPSPYPLTWMDGSVDGQPVTPRRGFAVEIDALSYNAVHFACAWADHKRAGFARTFRNRLRNAEGEFVRRYWDDARGYLADSHDGEWADTSLRPNQLWALALPHRPISHAMAHAALQAVTRDLWTPLGLRTLAPSDPSYRGRYGGDHASRERSAHQGSVWPWLTGLFADAVLATLGSAGLTEYVAPILARMVQHIEGEGCIGQVSELFDGDAPHRAEGAPARAINCAELYRAQRLLSDTVQRASTLDAAARATAESASSTAKRAPHSKLHARETLSK